MPKEIVIPKNTQPPIAPHSAGTRVGRFSIPQDVGQLIKARTVVTGDVRAQTRCVPGAIKRIVEAGGGALSEITFDQRSMSRWRLIAVSSIIRCSGLVELTPNE
jgi:enamine deaminase RidA (YjgF/YER057c/UK114 family)